jgi:hypothetical protein
MTQPNQLVGSWILLSRPVGDLPRNDGERIEFYDDGVLAHSAICDGRLQISSMKYQVHGNEILTFQDGRTTAEVTLFVIDDDVLRLIHAGSEMNYRKLSD